MRYEEALAGLNAAQKQAVTTTEGPVLVIAGPGTGKTQLLTTRVAHILATTDALPQNILCLTFTDSAAQTMRERLAAMIGQGAYDVTISTYHAFGSDIIRRFPEYFADEAELQPIDDLGIDRLFREIIHELPYSNPLKYADAYVSDIKTLVSDAKRALLSPLDVRMVARHNLAYIAQASPVISECLRGIVRLSKKDQPAFITLAQELRGLQQTGQLPKSVVPLSQQVLTELDEALAAAVAENSQTPLTKWKNRWLAKDEDGQFILDGLKANQKLAAAADVYEQYLTEFKARGLFDYDDMILRAVGALERHNDLRFSLQEQYLYLLLDEFQDTNGAQLRLVELLTNNPVNEGHPNILAVGDDDQAIYAFQGADYSHMLRFTELYRDVLVVPLTQNYRSHAAILHTARGVAAQIEERLHHHFAGIKKELTAENTQLPKEAIIERREAQSDVMQYAWVAKRIKELLGSGIPADEIAVLAPQHKYLEPLVPFLQQAGIPLRYEKRENVLEDPAVNQLLRMAELCLALAENDSSRTNALWSEVLSFEFWQLPTSLIWRLAWQTADEDRNWTDTLLADNALKPIALFFIRLSQIASYETLETMLDYLIGTTALDLNETGYEPFNSPYYRHYFGHLTATGPLTNSTENARFWELLTNLVVLRARLREYRRDGEEQLHIADLIGFVEAHRAADLKILNTSPYASAREAIQLMTAFKAKGMEFAAVFLLAVTDEAWGNKARGTGNRISLPPNLQFIRYAGATNDERLRLFYVAITRAKSQLYLMSYVSNYAGKATTRLRYLNEITDEKQVTYSPLLPPGKQIIQPAEDGVPEPTTELAAYWQQRHESALSQADLRALLYDRLNQFQLSPTHVSDFTDLVHAGPQAFFLRTILRFPKAARPEMQFGNAMHQTLEWIHQAAKRTGKVPSDSTTIKVFEERLRHQSLNTHDFTLFFERGALALKAYLKQRAPTILTEHVIEYNFRGEGVFIDKAHLSGQIDKLIINREAKTLTIVDYKTGRSHTRWSRDIRLHRYRQQLYLYRALLEGSHTYAGYQVEDAYLEFIEPDEQGIIRELHLTFDKAEYARIKLLAAAIWRRIMALDLPDTSQYSPDLNGVEAFEEDLLAST